MKEPGSRGEKDVLTKNVQRLHHFLSIAEHGSISRAAQSLGMSQPALSKSLQWLERAMAVQLVERSAYGIVLTVFGESLAAHARSIFAQVGRANDDIAALRGIHRGHVRVGAGPSIVATVLPHAIEAFTAAHRKVRINVLEGLVDDLLGALRAAKIDIAIVSQTQSIQNENIVCLPVMRDNLVVVAGRKHPLASKKRSTLEELSKHNWVLPTIGEPVRQRFDLEFTSAGIDPPVADIETTSAICMTALLQDGHYLTWVPQVLVESQLAQGKLVRIDVPATAWSRQLYICHNLSAMISPACSAFLVELKRTFVWLEKNQSSKTRIYR